MNFGNDTKNFILNNFNSKIFDNESLQKLRLIIVTENNEISKYLEDIVMTDLRKMRVSALYDSDERKIFLDIDIMKQEVMRLIDNGQLTSNNYELYLTILLYFSCLHEAVHSYQRMIVDERVNVPYRNLILDSENAIMGNVMFPRGGRIGSIKNTLVGMRLYNQFHDYYPAEIHANVVSSSFLYPLLEEMMPKNVEVSDMRFISILSLLKGYDKDYCPIDIFYKEICGYSKPRINLSDYTTREKFMFGLPLTKEELELEIREIDNDYSGFLRTYSKR